MSNIKHHKGNYYTSAWDEDISNQNPDGSLKYYFKGTAHGGGCYISDEYKGKKTCKKIIDECDLDDHGRMLEV